MLQASQDEVVDEVGDELGKSKSFWSHFTDCDELVADNWVNSHEDEVGKCWSPKVVKAIEKSSVSISDSPEPNRWSQVKEILLGVIGFSLILTEDIGKDHSPVDHTNNHA